MRSIGVMTYEIMMPYSTLKNWLNKKRKMRNDFVEKGLKYFDD